VKRKRAKVRTGKGNEVQNKKEGKRKEKKGGLTVEASGRLARLHSQQYVRKATQVGKDKTVEKGLEDGIP